MKVKFVLLCILLIGLNVLDAALTHAAWGRGALIEANPLMVGLIDYSWGVFWLVKMSLFAAVVSIIACLAYRYPEGMQKMVVGLIVVFTGVCFMNALVLL